MDMRYPWAAVKEAQVAPGLLLSMPHLEGPHFARAVVLMVEHNEEGSFGLIVNSPSDLTVGELMDALDIPWHGDPRDTVWSGGPVMPASGWVIHETISGLPGDAKDLSSALSDGGTFEVGPGLSLSTSTGNLRTLAESPPERLRFLLGYAGWGAGQLAQEMAEGSWLYAPLEARLIFEPEPDAIWSTALRSLGVDPESIAQSHGVH